MNEGLDGEKHLIGMFHMSLFSIFLSTNLHGVLPQQLLTTLL